MVNLLPCWVSQQVISSTESGISFCVSVTHPSLDEDIYSKKPLFSCLRAVCHGKSFNINKPTQSEANGLVSDTSGVSESKVRIGN